MSDRHPVWSDDKAREWVWLEWHDADAVTEGGVSISGQSLGSGEYEYAYLVKSTDLPALWAAFDVPFGEDRDALALAVRGRYDELREMGNGDWLEQHGVPFQFWARSDD